MTTAELIEKLKSFPADMPVYFDRKSGEVPITDALEGESEDAGEWSDEERERYEKTFGSLPDLPAEFVLLVSE